LLATLEQLGAVRRDHETDKFWLGPEIVRLASEVPFSAYVTALARPFLTELAEATLETVNFCLPEGDNVLHADQVTSSEYLVGRRDWVGFANPLHVASNGKVMLAYWPESEIERYLAKPLERLTEHTITNPEVLRAELVTIREQGYALGREELEIGLVGISAPVFVKGGAIVAAVNVSGPVYRLTEDRIPDFSLLTVKTAAQITKKLHRKT
jgi:DNA-binding IclR family transcriptional regulator